MFRALCCFLLFFFNDTAPTELYTLSLHDALPICRDRAAARLRGYARLLDACVVEAVARGHRRADRSEEHTSELQSHVNLVCRLLLEKKKKKVNILQLSTPSPDTLYTITHYHTTYL